MLEIKLTEILTQFRIASANVQRLNCFPHEGIGGEELIQVRLPDLTPRTSY